MNTGRRRFLTLAVLAVTGPPSRAARAAGPEAELWQRWEDYDPGSTKWINHKQWRRFLSAYVEAGEDGVNRVRYGAVTEADRGKLDAYVESLTGLAIATYNREEQFAYWINLYNAVTLAVVLDHYPVKSIMDISISPGFFSIGPWGKKLIVIDGEELSLDDIEHRILRPIWRDARIHYAVNCAAIGCPDLQPTAFTAANGDILLDLAAQNYVNHRRGARVENGALIVSKIYAWFTEDFGGSEQSVIAHIRYLAEPFLAKQLEGITAIEDYEYDWSLNDAGKISKRR